MHLTHILDLDGYSLAELIEDEEEKTTIFFTIRKKSAKGKINIILSVNYYSSFASLFQLLIQRHVTQIESDDSDDML